MLIAIFYRKGNNGLLAYYIHELQLILFASSTFVPSVTRLRWMVGPKVDSLEPKWMTMGRSGQSFV